jgi:streptogramin lyase
MQPTPLPANPPTLVAQNGSYQLTAINDFLLDDALFGPSIVRHPHTGQEFACFSLSRGGFLLLDPTTGAKRQIRAPKPFSTAWQVAQSPQGDLYQVDFISQNAMITRWDWTTDQSQIVGQSPSKAPFAHQAGPDGNLYILDYARNLIYHVNPFTGVSNTLADLAGIGLHPRHLYLGSDGMLYCHSYSHADDPDPGQYLIMVDPQTGQITNLTSPDKSSFILAITADKKVLQGTQSFGRLVWRHLLHGKPQTIDQATLRLTSANVPLVFSDGSYIDSHREWECTIVSPTGARKVLDIKPQGTPLRIFSVASATNRVWAGTFIPLRLASYDPQSHTITPYGNPTPVTGEIYALTGNDKTLYFSSYTQAWLTRLIPSQPLVSDNSLLANPGQLGKIKTGPLPLHRTNGVTQDHQGRIYFAALGGYGCPDSGIARIDPANHDQLTTWIFPNTTFGAMVYLKATHQLLVSEFRRGESSARFTLINPDTGEIQWSLPMLQDPANVVSWLADPDGQCAIGVFAYRATLLKFNAKTLSITHKIPEVRVGTHCHNALIQGLDGQVWGYTNQQVYKTDWNLTAIDTLFDLGPDAHPNHYRFGFCKGPDGALYFPDGTRLMRIALSPQ